MCYTLSNTPVSFLTIIIDVKSKINVMIKNYYINFLETKWRTRSNVFIVRVFSLLMST